MMEWVTWVLVILGAGVGGIIVYLVVMDKKKVTCRSDIKERPAENGLTNYNEYTMSGKEKLIYVLIAAAAIFAAAYVFYQSIVFSLLLTPAALFYPAIKTADIIKKRKRELNLQFKEALYSLSSSLSSGKSIEMSFKDALRDLAILYPAPDTFIIREFEYINRKLQMNETIETALDDFAGRSKIDDIQNFVEVFRTCKRTGGNLVQVMKNTSDIINDKITVKQEISAMLAQRKMEQKLLSVLPLGMIFLLSSSSADFMKPVFTQPSGRIVMTAAIFMLAAAYFISKKIMDIEV